MGIYDSSIHTGTRVMPENISPWPVAGRAFGMRRLFAAAVFYTPSPGASGELTHVELLVAAGRSGATGTLASLRTST